MPRKAGINLSAEQVSELKQFTMSCRKKWELRRGIAILLRGEGMHVAGVAALLHVAEKVVCRWTAAFMKTGTDGIASRKRRRVPGRNGEEARRLIPSLLEKEPSDMGIFCGRWTLTAIAGVLDMCGTGVSLSTVQRIMKELRYSWKRPKLRAPGSIRKNYRCRKIVESYKRIAPALREKGVWTLFEDEKWIELHPRVECMWLRKGSDLSVPTPGYTDRWNYFISLDYATGRIIWNSFPRRSNREFRRHLSNVLVHAVKEGAKRVILFVDKASYHDTPAVKHFLKKHPELTIKHLPKKDTNVNPVELLVNRKMSSFV